MFFDLNRPGSVLKDIRPFFFVACHAYLEYGEYPSLLPLAAWNLYFWLVDYTFIRWKRVSNNNTACEMTKNCPCRRQRGVSKRRFPGPTFLSQNMLSSRFCFCMSMYVTFVEKKNISNVEERMVLTFPHTFGKKTLKSTVIKPGYPHIDELLRKWKWNIHDSITIRPNDFDRNGGNERSRYIALVVMKWVKKCLWKRFLLWIIITS